MIPKFRSGLKEPKICVISFLKTYENISKYSTSFATDSEPDSETLGGYNQIYIDPPRAHVAFEWYGVSYNIKTNLVESINATKVMFDIDFCTEQLDSWIPRIEKKFSVKCVYKEEGLTFTVKDQGPGFDYDNLPDPTDPENIEKPNGRGVFLMRNLADEVIFEEDGRVVELNFNLS